MKKIMVLASFLLAGIFISSIVYAHEETREVKTGTLSGQIMIKDGGPMAGGMLYFFDDAAGPPPSATKYWRVPAEIFNIDNNGRFTAELPEGKYYLGAIKKTSGEPIGPPQEGDLFFISQDGKGNPKMHTVKKGETTDLGIISGAVPFNRASLAKDGITAIEGAILDVDGKPVEGALVFAFMTQTMAGKPFFVSDKTGKDGRYIMRVQAGGKYYLRVRDSYGGGPPVAGNIMGIYGENEPVAVNVKTGQTEKGINIKVMKFAGRGPKKE